MPDLSDARLDALLRDSTMAVPYPAAPSLRTGVVAAIERGLPAGRVGAQPAPWPRRIAFSVAAVVLALALSVLALPGARTAVAEFFGIVEGQRIEILPTPEVATPASTSATSTPGPTFTAPPTPTATPFALSEVAQPATLDESRITLGFEPGVPREAGKPEAVYLLEWGRQPLLVLQYEDFDLRHAGQASSARASPPTPPSSSRSSQGSRAGGSSAPATRPRSSMTTVARCSDRGAPSIATL